MRTTCLVNNYNYREFVAEAVDSALAQSLPFDEIIVVDDGSTDDSLWHLRQRYTNEPAVSIVAKENGGQLSAFNAGMEEASGDLIFFLDADDLYRPDYLQHAVELYATEGIDFAIAGVESFGPALTRQRKKFPRRDLGYSTLATLLAKTYIGGPTSALSMHRRIAEVVLPCPFEDQWRTRADDVLVLGSSIAGARKYQMAGVGVDYRVHGSNNFSGRKRDVGRKLRHALAVNRLVHWYAQQMGFDMGELPTMLHREFQTIERPTFREWWNYFKMSWRSRVSLSVRARHLGETTQHYWQERLARRAAEPEVDDTTQGEILSLPQHDAQQRRAA